MSAVAGDVDYTAMYSKIYTISIDGGAINSSNVAAAIDGEIVTVKANKTVQNKVFKGGPSMAEKQLFHKRKNTRLLLRVTYRWLPSMKMK